MENYKQSEDLVANTEQLYPSTAISSQSATNSFQTDGMLDDNSKTKCFYFFFIFILLVINVYLSNLKAFNILKFL